MADPSPGRGEVLVDVAAAEANYPDILVMEGRYQVKPPLPFSPGKAAAGVVSALGEGVTRLAVGDKVAAQVEYGAYAEKLLARDESCFRIPDGMTFETAAALGLVYQTSYFALLERCQFQPGETVLVLGASGGVGSAAVQLAKAMGASLVIACTRGPEGAQVARSMGADHVIDTNRSDLREALRTEVSAVTNGHGADVVVDPVGGEAHAAAMRAMAWCGRMVIVGFAGGDIPAIRSNYLLVKNITVSGLQWSDYRDRSPEKVAQAQEAIFALWQAGKLDPHISKVLPLEQFGEALSALAEGRAKGKIVLSTTER
ncbi:NADPH:quinone oxidoreductase family protein [Tianweitania sediminis]|uniref:NADPH:quinone oxidoreductase family protein n=1 Tax=Tianweitania sediminis TaxID=1502156 RepID=UPI0036D83762